jgi:hypothetical protein
MRRRMRRQDHAARQENFLNIAVDRGIQIKIGQPVVNHVHRQAIVQQLIAVARKSAGSAITAAMPLTANRSRNSSNSGAKNCPAGPSSTMAIRRSGAAPRSSRHSARNISRIFGNDPGALVFPAMRGKQVGVEQTAAGVGVDFDQFRAVDRQMEVVAHEHATCRNRSPGDFRRPRQHRLAKGRLGQHRFDGTDNLGHGLQLGRRDANIGGRKKLWLALGQSVKGGFHRWAKKSSTTDNSRVRFIGGRLCHTRRP